MPPPEEPGPLFIQRRVGWWLLVARLSSGRTQADAAKALNLSSASSYGDFERGVTPPSLIQLRELARLFGVPVNTFMDPAETDEELLEEVTGETSKRSALAEEIDRLRKTG